MKTLYELTKEMEVLDSALGLDEVEHEKLQSEVMVMIQEKTDNCVLYQKSNEDFLEAIDKRIDELKKARSAHENKMKNFEKYVLNCLTVLGVESIQGHLYQVKARKPTKTVLITNENLIPAEYLKTKTEVSIDKVAIKEAIKEGATVPGAGLVDGKESVMFQVKGKK